MRFATISRWQCSGSRSRQSRQSGLRCREPDRLAEIEQRLWLAQMLEEDALEACYVSGVGRVAPALGGAEPAQMAIGDARLGKMRRELMLGEALLARDGGRADVEHELDPAPAAACG